MTPHSCKKRALLLATAGAFVSATSAAQTVVISDDFETNSAANYTLVDDTTPDGTQQFAFDYVAAGIPLAPRSSPGDTGGLRLTANDTAGTPDAYTLYHNTPVSGAEYRLTVDVWMNFLGTSGTTEFAHVGVGGNGTTFNQVFSPISGSGAFLSFTGDGGSGSDYRWFRDPNNTPAGETSNTTLPNSHYSYLGNGSNNTGAFFQALFPAPPSTIAGSPGNIWTTVEINVNNVTGVISFYFDGQLTFEGLFAGDFNGFASLGMADVFTSVAAPAAMIFTLYDNLEVEVTPLNIGTNYCMANANSTGVASTIVATGSNVVADNDVTLIANQLPVNAFGFFITSQTQGFVANPNGSQGNLCVLGMIGRYVGAGQIQNSGATGTFSLALDLTQTPQPTSTVSVMAGETWNYQGWHRDTGVLGPTSNFTDGVAVLFQ